MNKNELNDWAESLRVKLELFATIAGALYGVVTLLVFGPIAKGAPEDWGFLHLLISAGGPFALSLGVYHSILVRQLAPPGAIGGAIYLYLGYSGPDLYLFFNLCGLTVVTLLIIGLTESHMTTGKISDFWRSYLYHPLGWTKHFNIKTNLD